MNHETIGETNEPSKNQNKHPKGSISYILQASLSSSVPRVALAHCVFEEEQDQQKQRKLDHELRTCHVLNNCLPPVSSTSRQLLIKPVVHFRVFIIIKIITEGPNVTQQMLRQLMHARKILNLFISNQRARKFFFFLFLF